MPFVFKFSGFILFLSFVSGQLWLHDAASSVAIARAHSALNACPALGQQQKITSQFDVIRVMDASWMHWLLQRAHLSDGCGN